MGVTAIHLIIHGRVQGVSYRAWTVGTARRHGITGWVRNRSEGTVEAVLCGTEAAIDAMREECKRGPLAAKVQRLEEEKWTSDVPEDFRQLPTV